jgi:leader peptidase (prepilin peptidase) / N-methyltransferase
VTQLILPVLLIASPIIGSFLGVVIARSGKAMVLGRSHCEACNHQLAVRDLIPVLSWAARKGRCRYCGAKLGWFYPAVELAAMVPVFWAATLQQDWLLLASAVFGWLLLCLAWIDARTQRLPDALTLPLAASGLVAAACFDNGAILNHLIGAGAGFAGFWLLAIAYRHLRRRDGLGLGDAKLLAGLGAWLSWEGLPTVVFLGAAIAIALTLGRILISGKAAQATSRQRIAFGPALALAGWIVWLYGPLVPA